MIPSIPTHSNTSTPSNQDHLHLSPQQQQRILQQHNQHQSLASHFHLLHYIFTLTEHGTRDQQSDALVSDLNKHFEKCQPLLNSIAASLSTKAMTVEDQRRKLEESEQLLNQRRDMIAKYRSSVVELVKSEP
ncbi:hypothetical protein ACB098_05G027700 [Castanea mollissima]